MANTLTFANQTITDANIFGGINFVVDLNAEEEFTIGNTASASVTFETDIQLPLYTKDSTNGQFIWEQDGVARGRYYITEATKMAGRYTITAYDAMCLLGANVSALGVVPPATASVLANTIAAYMGCTVSGTIKNGSLSISEFEDDLTIRGLLSYIAEASGCSVKVDNAGHLCFMYYADSGITVSASEYIALEVADYTCAAIDNVTIFNSEGEIQATAGSGSNSLYIGQNPFLEEATNTHATAIYNAVKDFIYAPLTCDMFERNGIEVGTIATFGGVPTLVMHIESNEGGTTVSSVGSDARAGYNKDIITTVNETRAIAVDAQAAAASASSAAIDAQSAASAAQSQASSAASAASSAQSQAAAAASSASAASSAASAAQTSADNAGEYAARALGNLASVQSVAETLAWITAHGTMTLTQDVALDPSHVYFVVDAQGDYIVGGTHYSVVSEPSLDDIATYYELSIDESLNNYVATHLAVDSEGLWIIPDSGGNKVLIATGSGSTYTTAGTYIVSGITVLASFTANGIQVGQTGESHLEMDYHSMQLIDKEGNTYFHVSDLRDRSGKAEVVDTFIADGLTTEFHLTAIADSESYTVTINGVESTSGFVKYGTGIVFDTEPAYGTVIEATYSTVNPVKAYTLGTRGVGGIGVNSYVEGITNVATGIGAHAEGKGTTASYAYAHAEGKETTSSRIASHAEGSLTVASGDSAHAEGSGTQASGQVSHAEGSSTTACARCSHSEGENTTAGTSRSVGRASHAEGRLTEALKDYSHAEGHRSIADGECSHAEGYLSTTYGQASHAEGYDTSTYAQAAHAEGLTTRAEGQASHAQNIGTEAVSTAQTALGKYNARDANNRYAVIIGNGTSDSARSNALAVTWGGNVEMALDTTATSGTDYEIYDALVDLGWTDVIV